MDKMWKALQGKKTWLGIVLYAGGAVMRAVGAVTGLPLEGTAVWVEGFGIILMGVGAGDKLRRSA